MNEYQVAYSRRAVRDLDHLPRQVAERIARAVLGLRTEPRPSDSKKLQGKQGLYRLRVGDYRILYEIDDLVRVVTVDRVRHRREAYRF